MGNRWTAYEVALGENGDLVLYLQGESLLEDGQPVGTVDVSEWTDDSESLDSNYLDPYRAIAVLITWDAETGDLYISNIETISSVDTQTFSTSQTQDLLVTYAYIEDGVLVDAVGHGTTELIDAYGNVVQGSIDQEYFIINNQARVAKTTQRTWSATGIVPGVHNTLSDITYDQPGIQGDNTRTRSETITTTAYDSDGNAVLEGNKWERNENGVWVQTNQTYQTQGQGTSWTGGIKDTPGTVTASDWAGGTGTLNRILQRYEIFKGQPRLREVETTSTIRNRDGTYSVFVEGTSQASVIQYSYSENGLLESAVMEQPAVTVIQDGKTIAAALKNKICHGSRTRGMGCIGSRGRKFCAEKTICR